MNLALPSGSSPPEKPPGSMTIWLLSMALTSASQLAVTSAGVRLRMTRISGSAPAGQRPWRCRTRSWCREHRDDDLGFATPILGAAGQSAAVISPRWACLAVGVHRLQLGLPDLLQLGHIQRFAAGLEDVFLGGLAQDLTGGRRTPFPARWSRTWARTSRGWSYRPHLEADVVAQPILNRASAMPP